MSEQDELQAELKTIVRSENTLAEQLAIVIENETGLEVGTRENIEEVIVQIEERIRQTGYAISLLDEERHIVPLQALQDINEFYHLPALQNARERLEQVQYNNFE